MFINNAEIVKKFRFEAAHFLPNVPNTHQCHSMHGHSYIAKIHIKGPIDEKTGWIVDLYEIKEKFEPIRQMLDHQVLNKVNGLENPTSENLARWIFLQLFPILPNLYAVTIKTTHSLAVTVYK